MNRFRSTTAFLCLCFAFLPAWETFSQGRETRVKMAQFPSLSSDGARLLFDWKNDIWIANSKGGRARRLTQTEGRDTRAMFSPDGKTLAFTSNRDGSYQVYLMPVSGGVARQVTFHSEGSFAVDWYPDGKSILVRGIRDHAGRYAYRFFRVLIDAGKDEAEGQELREAPSLLFDATGSDASLSPDGKRLLFTREGMDTYRKGYEGSRASQIWLADGLEGKNPSYRRISPLELKSGARKPQWSADGMAFFYLGAHGKNGVFEVRISELREDGKMSADVEWTDSEGEFPVTHQRLSRDGSTLVYQRGFEIYRLDVSDAAEVEPKRINLWVGDDSANDPRDLEMRRVLKKATNLSFSSDGLEVAFIAGGDLWVMDTVLREPRRITSTPEEEGEPIFAPDNNSIFYIGDAGRSADVWRAERANAKAYWWLNDSFRHTKLTDDGEQKRDLHLVPGGKKIAYVRGLGDLWTAQYDGSKPEKVIESWSMPSVSWSPDGRWLAYAIDDDDFNRDIWIKPADGSQEPFNLSRHPDYDSNPAWSPDGKILAFTGRRVEDETDIYYVWLTREGEQQGKRDRTLRQAVEKMKKERKPAPGTPASSADPAKAEGAKAGGGDAAKPAVEKKNEEAKPESKGADEPKKAGDEKETPAKAAKPEVKIDFEGIYERIHRIKIANSDEAGLFWAPDSKRLAFRGEVKASKGTFMVTFPDKLTTPVALTSKIGSFARWTTNNDTILWMVDGLPATFSKGKSVMYPITALQTLNRQEYRREAFEQVWRTMRDRYYDESLNHLDWDGVYQRYVDMAATAPTDRTFDDVVEMLLGELNGSHMGFSLSSLSSPSSGPWKNETAHLGMQFDRFYQGEGWKISSVFTNGPADKTGMNLEPGDVITRVDGKEVNPLVDPAAVLNGRLDRDVALTVVDQVVAEDKAPAAAEGGAAEKPIERRIRLRPITYSSARQLGNQDHLKATRESVEKLSGGKLGYVYVPRMQWDEFVKFEEEIYARGAGREGLIIDVRDNGGGFTADHLLTVLTPPRHAFTVGRGGGRGYPQDRRVYAAWTKPIVVLCNQNSFSNAEIFAHAIQTLGRGKLVGEITAGGVISTGSTRIMDYGVLRLPGRGWFKIDDGEDMELNGAVPDVIVRNLPGEVPAGIDRQMERAVKVLLNDVDAAARKPSVDATPASDR